MILPMAFIGQTEALIVLIVIILVFGTKKIPEIGKGLAQGISEFKKGLNSSSSNNDNDGKSNDEMTNNHDKIE